MPNDPNDPFLQEVELTCKKCGMKHKVQAATSMKMKVGDVPYKDPRNPGFGKCKRCKTRTLEVTQVPSSSSPPRPPGFWKLPTDGSSSGTTTESSDEQKT